MKVRCVFALELPPFTLESFTLESAHWGNSNEYTQYTIFNNKKEKPSQVCSYRIFSKGLKNEFKTALVNKQSVFEALEVCCIWTWLCPVFFTFQFCHLRLLVFQRKFLGPEYLLCDISSLKWTLTVRDIERRFKSDYSVFRFTVMPNILCRIWIVFSHIALRTAKTP